MDNKSFILFRIFGLEYNSYIFRLSLLIFVMIHLIIAWIYLFYKLIHETHKRKLSAKKYKHLFRSLQALFGISQNIKAIKLTSEYQHLKETNCKKSIGIGNFNRKMIESSSMIKNKQINIKKSNLKSYQNKSLIAKSVSFVNIEI
jgi:hypothetical protein